MGLTDEGIACLAEIKSLEDVHLSEITDRDVTDAGLVHLAKLKNLKKLSLRTDAYMTKGAMDARNAKERTANSKRFILSLLNGLKWTAARRSKIRKAVLRLLCFLAAHGVFGFSIVVTLYCAPRLRLPAVAWQKKTRTGS